MTIELAIALKVNVPTEVLMMIKGESRQSFVFVSSLCTQVN